MTRRHATVGMNGMRIAITRFSTPKAGSIPISTTPARKIWTATASGGMFPDTEMFGRRKRVLTGLLIKTGAGFGNLIMDGPGCRPSRGVGRLITMDAGSFTMIPGTGGPDLYMAATIRSGAPHTFRSLVLADASDLVSDLAQSGGARLVRMTLSIPGTGVGSTIPTPR